MRYLHLKDLEMSMIPTHFQKMILSMTPQKTVDVLFAYVKTNVPTGLKTL